MIDQEITNWRELCRELINSRGADYYRTLERARKALADGPAADGELAELVAALRSDAIDCTCSTLTSGDLRRAADLLEQRHPAPVPVAERLPGPEDCDAEGRCWWFCTECPGEHPYWILAKEVYCDPIRWLPATALPLPQGEVE